MHSDKIEIEAGETVTAIGSQIRKLRSDMRLTLKDLGERTGVSPSMLSLVERGKTSPSIGTLVAISAALGVHMSDLIVNQNKAPDELVSRMKDQDSFTTAPGVLRRVLRVDRGHGVEIAINEYEPETGVARARPITRVTSTGSFSKGALQLNSKVKGHTTSALAI